MFNIFVTLCNKNIETQFCDKFFLDKIKIVTIKRIEKKKFDLKIKVMIKIVISKKKVFLKKSKKCQG